MLGSQLPATEKLLSFLVLEEEGETVSPVRSCQGNREHGPQCPPVFPLLLEQRQTWREKWVAQPGRLALGTQQVRAAPQGLKEFGEEPAHLTPSEPKREKERESVCLYRCSIDFTPVRLFGK